MAGFLAEFLQYLGTHFSLFWLLSVLCILFVLFWMSIEMEVLNLPPGRRGLPWIGSLDIFLGEKTLLQHFLHLFAKYKSDVVSIKIGNKYIISLNTFDAIKEAGHWNELSDRGDITLTKVDPEYKGIIHASGDIWRAHRKFCLRSLRDYGMGRSPMEEHIINECRHLLDHLSQNLNSPVEFGPLIQPAINNTICQFLFGKRYEYSDSASFNRMRELDRLMISIVPMWKPIVYSEYLLHIPGDLFGYKESRKRLDGFYSFIQENIDEHKRLKPEKESFINVFMKERDEQLSSGQLTTFTETQLKHTIMDLFMAATDTTVTFLRWAILLLSAHAQVQEKVYREIISVLTSSSDISVSMKDKTHLPYTEATTMEIHRWASISPISLPHTNRESNLSFLGYFIPKNSSVFQNIFAVHRDPDHWKNAGEFDPSNFLDDDGRFQHDDHLIPFSIGKRSCVGESLARMEIFLIFVSLLQHYKFSLPENCPKPNLEGSMQCMNYPPDYKVLITERGARGMANGYCEE